MRRRSFFLRSVGDGMRWQIRSRVLVGALVLLVWSTSALAQPKALKPIHLSHVYGYVLSQSGKPVAGVQVALVSGGPPSQAMKTDAEGYFDFPDAKGEYMLHVKIPGFAIAARQVIVGADLHGTSQRGPLYVMMKPVCDDCTSPIFTSKKEFDQRSRKTQGTE